ncbi:hypothetical protein CI089_13370 [Microbacterium sp. Yaish 1]|nr:hypothetical protein CI089_13370 [Microbacterium sp. Yaish 1]
MISDRSDRAFKVVPSADVACEPLDDVEDASFVALLFALGIEVKWRRTFEDTSEGQLPIAILQIRRDPCEEPKDLVLTMTVVKMRSCKQHHEPVMGSHGWMLGDKVKTLTGPNSGARLCLSG